MRIVFYAPDGAGDKLLVAAVMHGAKRHGDVVEYVPLDCYTGVDAAADVAACYGVRASTRIIIDAYRRAGKRVLFFDKGYWGRGTFTRVSIDGWHPTAYFRCGRGDTRLKAYGLQIAKTRRSGDGKVIYAATTQTWCDFYDLGPSRALDELLVAMLAAVYPGRVVYRPRPGYAKKHPELGRPIAGVGYSDWETPLATELEGAALLVTIGSNAAVEAVAAGVDVQVLGDNPCRLLNGEATDSQRYSFFRDLAWCQWTHDEYLSGVAWGDIRETMNRTA